MNQISLFISSMVFESIRSVCSFF